MSASVPASALTSPSAPSSSSFVAAALGESSLPRQISHVIKRDGSRVPFELQKIAIAIAKAGKATGEFDGSEAQRLASQVGDRKSVV
jgi:hypothetical protein